MFGRALRPLFLLADDATFLNHGSFGACPKEVLAEQGRVRLTMENQPDIFFKKDVMPEAGDTALRRAAAKVAAFVNAPAECVAFVENATAGVQAALRSIDLRAGDRILVTSHTYNAMRLMVEERCAQTGAVPLVVEIPTPTTAGDIIWRIDQALATHVKVAVVDHITSPTALVMPLERIIPKLRAHGALVVVDGAHAIGQIPIDLAALAPDWYVSNLHKWLFAPKGTAFFYASKDVAAKTRPNVVSHFIAMGFPGSFDYTGTRDNSGWLAGPAALRFFKDLQPDAVRAHQRQLLAKVTDLVTGLGGKPVAPIEMSAAMRSFAMPQRRAAARSDGDDLVQSLWEKHRIQVWSKVFAERLILRISAQVYVDEEDLGRLQGALERDGWPGR